MGPSLGALIQLAILLLTLIVFQIFKPTEVAKKRKLFCKLVGCVVTVFSCISVVINMNEDPNEDHHHSEKLLFLTSWITVEVIVGLALPYIFVTSYTSLKGFFGRLISIPFHGLISMMNGFKRIAVRANRIHIDVKV